MPGQGSIGKIIRAFNMSMPGLEGKRWDVLGIGGCAVDELVMLDRFPEPDSKMPVQGLQRQGGGLTATALTAAARLGAGAAYCARLGGDELSLYTLDQLELEGVDCSPCRRQPAGRPDHSVILIDTVRHTRTILYDRGDFDPGADWVTSQLVGRCRVLLIDHRAPLAGLRAAVTANALGIPVVADVEWEVFPGIDAFLAAVDHLIIGSRLARLWSKAGTAEGALEALRSAGRACAVVTDGGNGCWYSENGGRPRYQPAFQVEVADTTGCGDVFHGAYAAALARGLPVEQAVRIASGAAAVKATRTGGRAGIPNWVQLQEFLRSQAGG